MTLSSAYWPARDIATITHGETTGSWIGTRIVFDSREIIPGDIFIALRAADFPTLGGGTSDGHAYIEDALNCGAVGVIVEKVPSSLAGDPRVVLVRSTRAAFDDLATAARAASGARIFGVTGSVGKTSTRKILNLMLAAFGTTYTSQKNYNNAMGVPATLASLPQNADYAVIEMGMNHGGEIEPLTKMVRPHVALITTIAPAHVENFPDGLDGIARAKAEIFAGLEPGGVAIVPHDSPFAQDLRDLAQTQGVTRILSFGETDGADAQMISCVEARNGTRVTAHILGETLSYFIPAGKHQAMNALAALLALSASNLDIHRAAAALTSFEPVAGRGRAEQLDIGDPQNPVILIDESYNASPAAMTAAFRVVALIDPGRGGRRIAILGDMLELGSSAPKLHADLALPLRAANIDLVYTCGPLMKHLHDTLPPELRGDHRDNSAQMAKIVPDVLIPGDVVMVKGSHGSRMDLVVEALRQLPATKAKKNTSAQKETRHAI